MFPIDTDSGVLGKLGSVFEDLNFRHWVSTTMEHQRGGRVFDKFSVLEFDQEDRLT